MRVLCLALLAVSTGCFGAGAGEASDEVVGPAFVARLQNDSDGTVHVLVQVFDAQGRLAHEAAFDADAGTTRQHVAPLEPGPHRATLQTTYSKGGRASSGIHEFVVDAATCDGRWHETIRVQNVGDAVSSSATRACHPE